MAGRRTRRKQKQQHRNREELNQDSKKKDKKNENKGKKNKWLRVLITLVLFFLLTLPFLIYGGVRYYLASATFTEKVNANLARNLSGETELEQLDWQGWEISSSNFTLKNGKGIIKKAQINEVNTSVNISSYSEDSWELPHATVKSATLTLGKPEDSFQFPQQKKKTKILGLFPNTSQLNTFEILSLDTNIDFSKNTIFLAKDLRAKGEIQYNDPSLNLNLSNGTIKTPWQSIGTLNHLESTLHIEKTRLQLKNGQFEIFGDKELELNIDLSNEDGNYKVSGNAKKINIANLLPENWMQRLEGECDINFTYDYQAKTKQSYWQGKIKLTQGKIKALPFLDTIASYLNANHYKTLEIDHFSCQFQYSDGNIKLNNIKLTSPKKLHLKGNFNIQKNREILGKLNLGIPEGTLALLPGAEPQVFQKGEKQMYWAQIDISGTLDNPKENLSSRLIAAAIDRMPQELINTMQDFLPLTSTHNKQEGSLNPLFNTLNNTSKNLTEAAIGTLSDALDVKTKKSDAKTLHAFGKSLSIPSILQPRKEWQEGDSFPYAKIYNKDKEAARFYIYQRTGKARERAKTLKEVKKTHQAMTRCNSFAIITTQKRQIRSFIQIAQQRYLELRLLVQTIPNEEELQKMRYLIEDITRSVNAPQKNKPQATKQEKTKQKKGKQTILPKLPTQKDIPAVQDALDLLPF